MGVKSMTREQKIRTSQVKKEQEIIRFYPRARVRWTNRNWVPDFVLTCYTNQQTIQCVVCGYRNYLSSSSLTRLFDFFIFSLNYIDTYTSCFHLFIIYCCGSRNVLIDHGDGFMCVIIFLNIYSVQFDRNYLNLNCEQQEIRQKDSLSDFI